MIRGGIIGGILSLLAGTACACPKPDAPVQAFLKRHAGWSVVTESNLGHDDQSLWHSYRNGLCPGMAKADLQGDGRISYALVLVKDGYEMRVILLNQHDQFRETVLSTGQKRRSVVHTAPAGPAYAFETRKRYDLQHESFVFEVMEASATQYYWQDGEIRSALISD